MKKSRYKEEQIIAVLKRCTPGRKPGRHPPSRRDRADLLRWKAKFGGMNVSDAKKLSMKLLTFRLPLKRLRVVTA